jgi:hypothetical protein
LRLSIRRVISVRCAAVSNGEAARRLARPTSARGGVRLTRLLGDERSLDVRVGGADDVAVLERVLGRPDGHRARVEEVAP